MGFSHRKPEMHSATSGSIDSVAGATVPAVANGRPGCLLCCRRRFAVAGERSGATFPCRAGRDWMAHVHPTAGRCCSSTVSSRRRDDDGDVAPPTARDGGPHCKARNPCSTVAIDVAL